MSIKDALVRQNESDKIEIGEVVKRTLNGKFGDILRAYVNGKITSESLYHQVNPMDREPLSAERILGRIEAYNNVIYNLEEMVQEAEELQRPVEDDED